jgi:hypothetical protein
MPEFGYDVLDRVIVQDARKCVLGVTFRAGFPLTRTFVLAAWRPSHARRGAEAGGQAGVCSDANQFVERQSGTRTGWTPSALHLQFGRSLEERRDFFFCVRPVRHLKSIRSDRCTRDHEDARYRLKVHSCGRLLRSIHSASSSSPSSPAASPQHICDELLLVGTEQVAVLEEKGDDRKTRRAFVAIQKGRFREIPKANAAASSKMEHSEQACLLTACAMALSSMSSDRMPGKPPS